ncbi:DUF4153 domain-containing protein [Patulibacter sp. NPDC049589]|uniref:DUF4153 domain-containing protein n=1 Tax=Patulibacter sp. NPDC049589 TaxID=3154731 RepID=UPI003442263A
MSKHALIPALVAGALSACAVAEQRVGLALSLALLAVIAAGVAAAPSRVDRPVLGLAVLLALQPTLRDAGWVVVACTVAALVGGAGAVASPGRWPALGRLVVAPLRLLRGGGLVVDAVGARTRGARTRDWAPVARGAGLAAVLVAGFGALFASADPAFAEAGGELFDVGEDPWAIAWRLVLGAAACAAAGAIARAGLAAPAIGPWRQPRLRPGRTELRMAVGALVVLFAAFVVVQLPILFGGDDHVLATGGLGYGDYARAGFLQLLVVAALTLAVVGVAARDRDPLLRGLLGALCVLTLVVLLSAQLRLGLVEDAYGLTRVRYGGQAVLVWLAAVLVVVLLAGARASLSRRAPRIVLLLSLAAVLGFSITNPDGRIGASVVARAAVGKPIDRHYVQGLSADALHQLWRIPRARGGATLWRPIEARLERPDGIAGFNVGRWTAR